MIEIIDNPMRGPARSVGDSTVNFLQALVLKAGLPAGFWSPELQLWRYRVSAFEEPGHDRSH